MFDLPIWLQHWWKYWLDFVFDYDNDDNNARSHSCTYDCSYHNNCYLRLRKLLIGGRLHILHWNISIRCCWIKFLFNLRCWIGSIFYKVFM